MIRDGRPATTAGGIGRYGLAVLLAAVAAGTAYIASPRIGGTTPLFYGAVMLTAWWAGLGPALFASLLNGALSGWYRLNRSGSPGFGVDDTLQLMMFVVVACALSSLMSRRRRAELALQKSHDELEIRIERRTRELSESNTLLRESEERFRLLVDGVADYAIVTLDRDGRIVSWNPGAERAFGFTNGEAVGRNASAFYTTDDVARGKPAADLRAAADHGRHEDEGWRVRHDGSTFWANVIITALTDDQGRPRGFAQVTRDVSELRSLEKKLLDISDREQMRIGHDLHDGVGQELTGVALLAQNLRQKLARQDLPEATEAGRIAGLINRALEQTRQLARGFSPIELGPEGLETALRGMLSKVQVSLQRPCILKCPRSVHIADDTVALHLYRIAQEAVNNAVRHASPQHIWVELDTMAGGIRLSVHDDGIGMQADRGRGMGISVMQYRARLIGGTLEIRSNPRGTSVICTCSTSQQGHDAISTTHPQETHSPDEDALARAAGR